jgi:transposase
MWGRSWYGAPQMGAADSGAARRFKLLEKQLDERLRRCVAAAEAEVLGPRGISIVSRATGVSRQAIRRGVTELRETARAGGAGRIRQPGGGRKRTREKDPTLLRDLEHLVEPTTRGDPESPLRWTCKSTRQLATALQRQGHRVSHQLVSELLQELGYSLQANRKTMEGDSHPDPRCRVGARQSETGALSWRMELHRGTTSRMNPTTEESFLTTPKEMVGST